ncbi:MAG: prepilin-type N-terminal cleavage/methylation domain-containing protein [Nitrospirota bacterium]
MRHINKKGFSLLEVMVVVGIVGVLATIAIPNYRVWVMNNRLKNDVLDIKGGLRIAKMTAMATGQSVAVDFGLGVEGDRWVIFIDNGAGGGVVQDGVWNGCEVVILMESAIQRDPCVAPIFLVEQAPTLANGIAFVGTSTSISFSASGRRALPAVAGGVQAIDLTNGGGGNKMVSVTPIGEIF